MKNELTFIIVTWNNEDTILDCMDSIYEHCKNFNVIVVDNNSSDNTVNILKKKEYDNCNIISLSENLGFAAGNNVALEHVETPYICYLNPDTILIEDIIIPSITMLKSNNEIGLIGCKLLNSDKSLQASTFNFLTSSQVYFEGFKIGKFFPNIIREKYFPDYSKSLKNKYVDWVIGAEMVLAIEDARKIEGFSTDYFMYTEDMDLCKKINAILGKKVYYLADVALIHIGGASEVKNTNYNKLEKMIDNKIMFAEKYYNDKEVLKVKKALYNVYNIRYNLVKMFCWSKNRKYYLDKMKCGVNVIRNKYRR